MDDRELVAGFQAGVQKLSTEIGRTIVGQEAVVQGVLTSIFCNGHVLLVGVPGLAKTLLVKTVAQALDMSFNRIQFTPDLMPGDITGNEILDEERKFRFVKGPLFANIVLADEINRTPPKTQAALLEAMQERNVTVAGHHYELPKPFFVLATQNPIEQEGTYPLPEAQLDRFMQNIVLDYPAFAEEMQILKNTTGDGETEPEKVLSAADIVKYQHLVRRVPVTDHVYEYIVELVQKTRPGTEKAHAVVNEFVSYGAGPRAGQFLVLGAKCHALMQGKFSPDVEDVRAVAANVLRHRLVRNYKAEAEGISNDEIVRRLL
ncbi:MAG: MoxR family ATPase [Bacteroidetes bacterium]|nr:MoxR family ATPase [Bacteroidota bacterium]